MSLLDWLKGAVWFAHTLTPFLVIWACAVLWRRSGSGWALLALVGAASCLLGALAANAFTWWHYSSVAVMVAQDDHPPEALLASIALASRAGYFLAALGLVGYARMLPKAR